MFGTLEIEDAPDAGDGLFYHNSRLRFADVIDGLSSTLMVGERSSRLGGSVWSGVITGANEEMARIVGITDHAPNDPIAYFLLGNVNRDLFNARPSCGYLKDARSSYARMLELNPHLDESKNARNYVGQIDGLLPRAGCGA